MVTELFYQCVSRLTRRFALAAYCHSAHTLPASRGPRRPGPCWWAKECPPAACWRERHEHGPLHLFTEQGALPLRQDYYVKQRIRARGVRRDKAIAFVTREGLMINNMSTQALRERHDFPRATITQQQHNVIWGASYPSCKFRDHSYARQTKGATHLKMTKTCQEHRRWTANMPGRTVWIPPEKTFSHDLNLRQASVQ